jgi:hypothetical protein
MTIKDYLLMAIRNSAAWRERQAQQYPDDMRNAASARCLRQAEHDVSAMAPDDDRLLHLGDVAAGIGADAMAYYLEEQSRFIGRHGFDQADASTADLLAKLLMLADDMAI